MNTKSIKMTTEPWLHVALLPRLRFPNEETGGGAGEEDKS